MESAVLFVFFFFQIPDRTYEKKNRLKIVNSKYLGLNLFKGGNPTNAKHYFLLERGDVQIVFLF